MSDKNDIVIIELDRPRIVWFGHKGLKKLTALTGMSLDNMDLDQLDFETIEKVMYCGLLSDAKAHNEDLKLEDMEDLLDKVKYEKIIQTMTAGFQAAFGQFYNEDTEKNFQRVAARKKK